VARAILLGRLRTAGRVEIAMSASIFQKSGWAIAHEASDRMPAELHSDADETFNRLAKKISEGTSTWRIKRLLTAASTRAKEIPPRFAFRLRFHLPPHCFYKTIDAFSGYLYPQRLYIFPSVPWETSRQRYLQRSRNPP
jgi:hypothetical protein